MKSTRWSAWTGIGCAALVGCVLAGAAGVDRAIVKASGTAAATAADDEKLAVEKVLDSFHDAASRADGATYFGLFAPEGVFLGTDASERWDVAAFRAYAEPYFAQGRGWTYVPGERHVDLVPGESVAWFDELLVNEKYGVCRGSGVLRKADGAWRVCQYNLSVPVPNDLLAGVAQQIKAFEAEKQAETKKEKGK